MRSQTALTRWVGAAFVAQFITSLGAGILSMKLLTGDTSAALVAAASNPTAVRASGLLELLTAVGITTLAALLFARLGELDRPLALVALAMWIGEVALIAVRGLGLYGLAWLGSQVGASSNAAAKSIPGAATVALSLYQNGYTASMLFFCVGGLLWYSLLYRSRIVPRWLAGWGFVAVVPLLISTLATLWDRSLSLGILPGLPYAPFELFVGVWLVAGGGKSAARPETAPADLKEALG
jgi:hypothetical protein